MNVPEIAHLLLLYENKVCPAQGRLEDVPVFGGAELTIVFLGKQRIGSESTLDKSPHHHTPTADNASQGGEESHGLYHARAPSQPGNNGGAFPNFDHGGQKREENQGNGRASNTLGSSQFHHASTVGYAGQRGDASHGLYQARAPSQPGTNGGASSSIDHAGKRRDENTEGYHEKGIGNQYEAVPQRDEAPRGSGSYDKIRQTFKCPKFSGQSREWKQWHKGFMRYLSIWDLEYVLYPEFLDDLPLSPTKLRDNKTVYYIIEDAVQNSAMASSIVREAPVNKLRPIIPFTMGM